MMANLDPRRYFSHKYAKAQVGIIVLVLISVLVTRGLFDDKSFVYMQDTFLILKPSFLSEEVQYIWKPTLGTGSAYISNGYLFYSFFVDILSYLKVNLSIIEQSYIFVLVVSTLSSFFISLLMTLRPKTWIALGFCLLGSMLYAFNVYTLSINWFLIENWTAYAIIFPLIFVAAYRVVVERSNYLVPIFILILVSQLFAYGLSGPFIIASIFFVILFALIYNLVYRRIRAILPQSSILLAMILLASLPALLSSEISTGLPVLSLPSANLYQFMQGESSSTSLVNVLSLKGFIWLHTLPFLYPWYSNPLVRNILVIGSFILTGTFFGSCLIFRRNKLCITVGSIAIITIFFMKGLQPPLGWVEYLLVRTNFVPFYILINPYYFLGQILVFSIAFGFVFACYMVLEKKGNHSFKRLAMIIMILILVVSAALPAYILMSGGEYPNSNQPGNSLHRVSNFDLPASFSQLDQYFQNKNASVKALMLPPQVDQNLGYWNFANSTIVETNHLINQFVQIPLVSNGQLDDLAWDYAMNDSSQLPPLLAALNVKFVIVNSYSDAPQYDQYEISAVESNLNSTVGLTFVKQFGGFLIYEINSNPLPLIFGSNDIVNIGNNGWPQYAASYLQYPSSMTNDPVFVSSNQSLPETTSIEVTQYAPPNISDFSLRSFNWSGFDLLPNESDSLSITKQSNNQYLSQSDQISGNSWSIYTQASYSDLSNYTWKNTIIHSGDNSIYVQLFFAHNDTSSGALSIEDFNSKNNTLINWSNARLSDYTTSGTYQLLIMSEKNIITAILQLGDGVVHDALPLDNSLNESELSFMVVNTVVSINYSVFEFNPSALFSSAADHASNDVSVSSITVNPTSYRVNATSNSDSLVLVFQQEFDPHWVLSTNHNYKITHFIANGYENAWLIQSNTPINSVFSLNYNSQVLYTDANYLSVLLFFSSAIMIFVVKYHRKIWITNPKSLFTKLSSLRLAK